MESISATEENYLKAIYKICEKEEKGATNKAISAKMDTSAASVTDMLKRLAKKNLIHYEKHSGVQLTQIGQDIATYLVRKHRLWEVFLADKLHFSWDEIHPMAEELEHINSDELINRLEKFLGYPKFDPHGDPIPDAEGNIITRQQMLLSKLEIGEKGSIVGVQEHSATFLQYLDRLGLTLGSHIALIEKFEYDQSIKIKLNGIIDLLLSDKVSNNIFIKLNNG
ncbi:MAG: metal-dependent transcriptional regulator [Saprospiraceae bacterium]|nr:metal-dependent transcriptional regulator [Saprospiraceae bacterium]